MSSKRLPDEETPKGSWRGELQTKFHFAYDLSDWDILQEFLAVAEREECETEERKRGKASEEYLKPIYTRLLNKFLWSEQK